MIKFDTPFKPSDVGYNEQRFEVLNSHFDKMMRNNEIQAASYCLARDGKVFAHTSLGKFCYRENDDRELRPDSIHAIASITKLFCATAIFKLFEDGKIRLDQRVGEFIEEFNSPPFNEITLAHLLTHTSGLQADDGCFEHKIYMGPWDYIIEAQKKGDPNWIAAALKSGMRKKAGEEWAYCSFGFVILGEVISRVSGKFAHDYIIENICKPCEMNDSGFWDDAPDEILKRRIIKDKNTENLINSVIDGTFAPDEEYVYWSKIPGTGGKMYSTSLDLVKFGTMLINGGVFNGKRILGRKTVEKMTKRFTSQDIKDYCWNAGGIERAYALGPDLRNNLTTNYSEGTFLHEGAGACCLIMDPVEKLVAAWFVPFIGDKWYAHGLYNASAIIWSGLE